MGDFLKKKFKTGDDKKNLFFNSCFQHGEKFILLKKSMNDEKYSCNIMKMAYLVNFHDKPVQSKDLCICYVKNLEAVLCEEHIYQKAN